MGKRRGILTVIMAVILCLATAIPVWAYFTTYVKSQGSQTVITACETKLVEDKVDKDLLFKSIHVENLEDSTDVFIRVKAVCPADYKIDYTAGTFWTSGPDGWMYYNNSIAPETQTENLEIWIKQTKDGITPEAGCVRDFNVIVLYESSPVAYAPQ